MHVGVDTITLKDARKHMKAEQRNASCKLLLIQLLVKLYRIVLLHHNVSVPCKSKGLTKRTLCGIVLFKLNTFFSHVFTGP